MIIRIIDSLSSRQQWIEFCRRERPYCFVRRPDTLIDFQTTYLTITLLNQQVRHGQQATKYSIGSRASIAPAWQFIKACQFDLQRMIDLLQQQQFDGNARDNALAGLRRDTHIRKFFAKERAVVSPAFLGPLQPLTTAPAFWDLHTVCRLLANQQFEQLRSDSPDNIQADPAKEQTPETKVPDAKALLLTLIENPDRWQIESRPPRLYIYRNRNHLFSLIPMMQQSGAAPLAAQSL
ncbi:MAG: hypothetical protein V7707_18415 [Motiliproteus sp.]